MHLGQAEGTAGFSGLGPSQHPIPLDTEGLTTGQRGPTASQGLGKSGSEKVSLNWLPWDLNLIPPPPGSSSTLVLNFSFLEVCMTAVSGVQWGSVKGSLGEQVSAAV